MKIGPFLITRYRSERLDAETLKSIDTEYARLQKAGKRLVLGTLPSRSGTKWLCDIFDAHEGAHGAPERSFDAVSFYRYIKYNKLPIDTAGVVASIKHDIIEDWKKADLTLVFSPHFSHGIAELYEILKPEKVIFALNDPEFTVQSMYNKGFFTQEYIRGDNNLAIGYQPGLAGSLSQMFGRLVPNGPFYDEWLRLTRIGKIAWWGNMVVAEIDRQMQMLPPGVMDIFHLKTADQNYEWYKKLAATYHLAPLLSEKAFLAIKGKKFKASENTKHVWTETERREFEKYTADWCFIYEGLYR